MLETGEIADLREEASVIIMLNRCDVPIQFLQKSLSMLSVHSPRSLILTVGNSYCRGFIPDD